MKTLNEIKAFCQGYVQGLAGHDVYLHEWDDWFVWEGYDIQFSGADNDELADTGTTLACTVYEAGYDQLPETPLYRFAVHGKRHVFTDAQINAN
jgi:hypothetical protein